MTDRDINIGGDAKNVVNVTGDKNVVTFTSYENVTLPPAESVDIGQTLEELAGALRKLTMGLDEHSQISEALEKASQEASADEPDRKTIGEHVEKALDVAKTAGNFIDICKTAGPHVASAASWLGENWYKLLPLVGLAIG